MDNVKENGNEHIRRIIYHKHSLEQFLESRRPSHALCSKAVQRLGQATRFRAEGVVLNEITHSQMQIWKHT